MFVFSQQSVQPFRHYKSPLFHTVIHIHLISLIYSCCRPVDNEQLQRRVSAIINDVGSWMRSNKLQPNTAKTEVLWLCRFVGSIRFQTTCWRWVWTLFSPWSCYLPWFGLIDADACVQLFCGSATDRSVRRSVSRSDLQSLIASLVLSRLDFGSATLAWLPARLLDRLQSVLNAAERLVYGSRKHDHVTPLFQGSALAACSGMNRVSARCTSVSMELLRHTLNFSVWLTLSHDSNCVQLRLYTMLYILCWSSQI